MSDILHVIARITANEGKAEALVASVRQLVVDTRAEEGCLRYVFTRSVDDPNVFVFVEEWSSHDLWQAHIKGPAIAAHRARLGDGVVASSVVDALTLVA